MEKQLRVVPSERLYDFLRRVADDPRYEITEQDRADVSAVQVVEGDFDPETGTFYYDDTVIINPPQEDNNIS